MRREKMLKLVFFVVAIGIFMAIEVNNPVEKRRQEFIKFKKMNDSFMANKTKNYVWVNPIPLSSRAGDGNQLMIYNGFSGDPRSLYGRYPKPRYGSIPLQQDFYSRSCPSVEKIVRDVVKEISAVDPTVTTSLLRLLFNDCFVKGCDASILLDSDEFQESEKIFPPNKFLKGLDIIETIKSKLESVCPGVVSCSDIIVLAAREAVLADGGPGYRLLTGRKDSLFTFPEIVASDIPSPFDNLSKTLTSFEGRGFDESETVCLMGSRGIGMIHCVFLEDRLYNFSGTGESDPSLDPQLLKDLKSKCPRGANSNMSGISDEKGSGIGFGTIYFQRLMENKGLVLIEKELMVNEKTRSWVRAYALDPVLFRRHFALVMVELSNLRFLTGVWGLVRKNCSVVI